MKGLDPDGDPLTFGVINTFNSEMLKIENVDQNQANIYLNKELDREIKDEYSIILTLTDNKLGDGNFVTQSLLLLVEDINDNEPVFKVWILLSILKRLLKYKILALQVSIRDTREQYTRNSDNGGSNRPR